MRDVNFCIGGRGRGRRLPQHIRQVVYIILSSSTSCIESAPPPPTVNKPHRWINPIQRRGGRVEGEPTPQCSMEQKTPTTNKQVPQKCNQKYPIMSFKNAIPKPFPTKVHEHAICEGIDDFRAICCLALRQPYGRARTSQ